MSLLALAIASVALIPSATEEKLRKPPVYSLLPFQVDKIDQASFRDCQVCASFWCGGAWSDDSELHPAKSKTGVHAGVKQHE